MRKSKAFAGNFRRNFGPYYWLDLMKSRKGLKRSAHGASGSRGGKKESLGRKELAEWGKAAHSLQEAKSV